MKNCAEFDLALIDNYINKGLLCFDAQITYFKYFRESDTVKKISQNQVDTLVGRYSFTHATKCAAFISPKEGRKISIANICVLENDSSHGMVSALLAALKWVEKHRIPIIHLSIGTCEIKDGNQLRPIVRDILNNGQLIVAAQSNNHRYTFPSNISGVVSVEHQSCADLQPPQEYCDIIKPQIQVIQNLTVSFCSPFGTQTLPSCNSFAAASITSTLLPHYLRVPYKDVPSSLRTFIYKAYSSASFRQGLFPDFVKKHITMERGKSISSIISQKKCIAEEEEYISVIVHSPNEQFIVKQLLSMAKIQKILGVVFCFHQKVSPTLRSLCSQNGWLMWSEYTHLNSISNVNEPLRPLSIPCVNIWGDGISPILSAHRLCNLFVKNNYQSLVMSNIPKSYLCGCIYFNSSLFSKTVMSLNSAVLQLSVLIIASQRPFLSADISISATDLEKDLRVSFDNIITFFTK